MKKILVICGAVLIVIVVAALIILGNINSIVKNGVEKAGSIILKAPVKLANVDISIFSGSGVLKGSTIGNPEGFKTDHAFYMDTLKIDLYIRSITSDKIHIKNIIIDSPDIVFEGGFRKNNLNQLQSNVKDLTSSGTSSAKNEKPVSDSGGKKIRIDYIKIQNASIRTGIGIFQGKKLTITLPTIELKNIGKEKDVSISDALEMILGVVNKAVIPVLQSKYGSSKELKKIGHGFLPKGIQKLLPK